MRLVLLALAGLLGGFGLGSLGDARRCEGRAAQVLRFALGGEPLADTRGLQRECRGSHALAVAAYGLARQGHAQEALALADEALRREPDNHEAWVALAAALTERGLDRAAARARREVLRLNPRYASGPG